MRFSFASTLVVALAADCAVASTWFSKAVYNKWHETELERWLSDHSVPYPTPADRKDLENLIKDNWQAKVVTPYNDWETPQLQAWLKLKGLEAESKTVSKKDDLVKQLESSWTETADAASSSYANVREWIFDSWSDSRLKEYADKHGIPVPQPRTRDSLLKSVRENYETVAKKFDQYSAYPGNWLYETWTESDLKQFLDERGIPAPQPSSRDRLVATVRRNSRVASLAIQQNAAAVASSATAAQSAAADAILDAWSDSQIKEWADKQGIKVPQGSKRNELIAIGRRNSHLLFESASSAFGAASTRAGNEYARATDDAQLKAESAFDAAVAQWSASQLKAYLDARGIPVPQAGKRDELMAAVRRNKHRAATAAGSWDFDHWTRDDLQAWLKDQNNKAAKNTKATRDDLLKAAQDNYASASKAGGNKWASATNAMASRTAAARADTFDAWSESDLKRYLDSYGVQTYQGSTVNELRAAARNNAQYFRHGTTKGYGEGLLAKLQDNVQWVLAQIGLGAQEGSSAAASQATKAGDRMSEEATAAKHRVEEAAQAANNRLKEEL